MTNSSWAKTERGTCEMFSEPEDWSSVGGTKGTGGGGIRPGASDGQPRGRGLVPRTMSKWQGWGCADLEGVWQESRSGMN